MKRILNTLARKWPEYLLEILVITIGIFGAFLLNSWKESQDNISEERNILLGLKKECEINISELSRNIKLNNDAIATNVALMEYVRAGKSMKNSSSFDSLLIYSSWFGSFDAQTGVVDETISSGKLSLIRNDFLRERLTGISGILKNAQEDYVLRINYYNNTMIPYYSKYFALSNADRFLDYSSWSEKYQTIQLKPSPFPTKSDEIDLLQFENILWFNKLNNDFVNLNEQGMKDFFQETLTLINQNLTKE